MTESSANRRIKPTLDTPFHIDYDWWTREDRNLRAYLITHLSPEQQEHFRKMEADEELDWIDPVTAEVRRVDGLQMALQEATQSEDAVKGLTSLVDVVFRIFLSNGNQPLTPRELGEKTGRTPDTILKTIAGASVYKGIRPVAE